MAVLSFLKIFKCFMQVVIDTFWGRKVSCSLCIRECENLCHTSLAGTWFCLPAEVSLSKIVHSYFIRGCRNLAGAVFFDKGKEVELIILGINEILKNNQFWLFGILFTWTQQENKYISSLLGMTALTYESYEKLTVVRRQFFTLYQYLYLCNKYTLI